MTDFFTGFPIISPSANDFSTTHFVFFRDKMIQSMGIPGEYFKGESLEIVRDQDFVNFSDLLNIINDKEEEKNLNWTREGF